MRQAIFILIGFVLVSLSVQAQNAADQYYDPEEMAAVRAAEKHHHGGTPTYYLLADRFEYQSNRGEPTTIWDAQGWYGTDLNKFWLKSEGEYLFEDDVVEEAEVQGLYSRAFHSFWDFQAGVRHDITPNPSRTYAVIGLQGLAPYWFEIDLASFLSNKGDVSIRLEAEYEIRLQQRLILQPRIEANVAFSDDEDVGVASGFSSFEAGIRLRYEITQEIAPYFGINWTRSFGETADLIRGEGEKNERLSFVAGVRFWY